MGSPTVKVINTDMQINGANAKCSFAPFTEEINKKIP